MLRRDNQCWRANPVCIVTSDKSATLVCTVTLAEATIPVRILHSAEPQFLRVFQCWVCYTCVYYNQWLFCHSCVYCNQCLGRYSGVCLVTGDESAIPMSVLWQELSLVFLCVFFVNSPETAIAVCLVSNEQSAVPVQTFAETIFPDVVNAESAILCVKQCWSCYSSRNLCSSGCCSYYDIYCIYSTYSMYKALHAKYMKAYSCVSGILL